MRIDGNVPMLVLRSLLTKRGWHAANHLVRVETFDDNAFRRLYQHLVRLHAETEADVTVEALRADVAIHYARNPDRVEEMNLVLDRLAETEELDQDLMGALIKRFLERSISYEIAEYVSQSADKPEFSIAHVTDLATRAMEIGDRVDQTVTDVLAGPLSGAPDNRRVAHALGFSRQLDACLRGGVAGGELLVLVSAPNVGKTSFLCRAGATHAARGGRVLHVTMEINTRKVIERYDEAWTHRNQDELATPDGQQAATEARRCVREVGGHVWVIDWAYLPASANDVGALVRRMNGTRCECGCGGTMAPDMVVIDYLQLMHPSKVPGKEMRQSFSVAIREHRALARNLEIPLLTAWQVNREGSQVSLLSMKDVAESWDLPQVADIIVGLNPRMADDKMVLNVVKQREARSRGVFEVYADLERMVIRDWDHTDTDRLVNVVLGRDGHVGKTVEPVGAPDGQGGSADGGGGGDR